MSCKTGFSRCRRRNGQVPFRKVDSSGWTFYYSIGKQLKNFKLGTDLDLLFASCFTCILWMPVLTLCNNLPKILVLCLIFSDLLNLVVELSAYPLSYLSKPPRYSFFPHHVSLKQILSTFYYGLNLTLRIESNHSCGEEIRSNKSSITKGVDDQDPSNK